MADPFVIAEAAGEKSVVKFRESAVVRTQEADRKLQDLARSSMKLILDVSSTKSIASEWLRLFARLTVESKEQGRQVTIRGMSDQIKKTADALALAKTLVHE